MTAETPHSAIFRVHEKLLIFSHVAPPNFVTRLCACIADFKSILILLSMSTNGSTEQLERSEGVTTFPTGGKIVPDVSSGGGNIVATVKLKEVHITKAVSIPTSSIGQTAQCAPG